MLERHKSTIRSDHDALNWILEPVDHFERLKCSKIPLSRFQFPVVDRAGLKIRGTGPLLLLSTVVADTTQLHNDVPEIML